MERSDGESYRESELLLHSIQLVLRHGYLLRRLVAPGVSRSLSATQTSCFLSWTREATKVVDPNADKNESAERVTHR